MEEKKKQKNNLTAICKLIQLLKNTKNTFICIQCCEQNSFETYNNILNFVQNDLGIFVCIIDITSIYNCENVMQFLKGVFLDFLKYIKRKKIYKSAFILPYFDDWVIPTKAAIENEIGIYYKKNISNESISDRDSKKRSKEELHMYIFNSICYVKNNLLKKLNQKYCVKLIGFHKSKKTFLLYSQLFDYNIIITKFIYTLIPYYIHINKRIKFLFKNKKLSINAIYNILFNKLDFVSSCDKKNDIDLFKCFFKYYYDFFQNGNVKAIKNEQHAIAEAQNVKKKGGHSGSNISDTRGINIWENYNFKLFNLLTNLKHFQYIKKYKYFLKEKRKKFSMFLFFGASNNHSSSNNSSSNNSSSNNSSSNNSSYSCDSYNFLNYILKKSYTIFFLTEYINTYLRKHLKLTKRYCSSCSSCNRTNSYTRLNGFIHNKHNALNKKHPLHKQTNYKIWKEKHKNMKKKLLIQKRFLLKNNYQNNSYNIYNSEKSNYIKFYFSKIKLPQTFLIYGNNSEDKTTLMNFIIYIICSNYDDIYFHYNYISFNELMAKNEFLTEKQENNGGRDNSTERGDNKTKRVSVIERDPNEENVKNGFNSLSEDFNYSKNINKAINKNVNKAINKAINKVINKMYHKEKKKLFFLFQNVCIIPFKCHLLINKTMATNGKYIKNIFFHALKNQPSVIIFDNIDLFLERNNQKYSEDENETVYKNIYHLLTHYLNVYINSSNNIQFIATSSVHPKYFKFSFLNIINKMLFIS
ncbi:conserved protein, unknown function [Hepatocystis sp. ex Piliocolobus tephrosceles]|nr:conserved protein, unknown function [Hepatocystis sp. ex Piliocolobus tephrosceles]